MSREKRIITLLASLVCSSCAISDVQKPEEEDDDAVRAQMQVKAALLEAEQVAAAPVRVEYESGRVRLTGFVETEAEKKRAGEVAKRAVPDVEVVNDLRVWRPSEESIAQ
ncbi:MAG: BON domain-containing protein [Woeseia sp.]